MRCKRCHGLIVLECCTDAGFNEGSAGVSVMRCVNCGAREYVRIAQTSGFAFPNPREVPRGGKGEICART